MFRFLIKKADGKISGPCRINQKTSSHSLWDGEEDDEYGSKRSKMMRTLDNPSWDAIVENCRFVFLRFPEGKAFDWILYVLCTINEPIEARLVQIPEDKVQQVIWEDEHQASILYDDDITDEMLWETGIPQ